MRNRDLEMKIARLQEIIGLWNRFYEITAAVLKGAEFGEPLENEFLELKSSLARKFQSLADKFPRKTFPEEEVADVLSQAVSLGHLKQFSSFAASEFQNQWHKVYISLNRMLGHMESERDELRKVSGLGVFIKRVTSSRLFKLLVILAVLAAVLTVARELGYFEPEVLEEEIENGPDIEDVRGFFQRLRERFGSGD